MFFRKNKANFTVIKHLLSKMTYRPGWRFVCAPTDGNHLMVHLTARTMNADNFSERVDVTISAIVDSELARDLVADDKAFLAWVRLFIQRLETHEMDEFIRFDGKKPFDPHRGENGH